MGHRTGQRNSGAGKDLRSDEDAYRDAFNLFLAGTDQKARTHDYVSQVIGQLPARQLFLDVGPGEGTMTCGIAPHFEHTVCIEPNRAMRRALALACPDARVLAEPVLQAAPGVTADLALLSHVLYYVPRPQWTATVLRVMEWIAPGGLLLVLLEHPDSTCMRMVEHFTGSRFDLSALAGELASAPPGLIGDIRLDTVSARYRTMELDEAVAVAGFHLSVPSTVSGGGVPPARETLDDYVRRHFRDRDGGYTIGNDQHVLHIERHRP
ncbi:methyltransferase domain-containing protein [Streptomyces sp. BG9H]|uniref:Methyltransferase domain-containing protein n=1 Tax=Streptomyces anatolicus TaxID=2675858 RepID=A0ABS6YPS6_9ACTN|nr:class I SAM-dependent methyltransferase [Streptomyces anatolicus]MBW5422576.1 methyltransferase domain-containing protein [Streptomyces anatolicus]